MMSLTGGDDVADRPDGIDLGLQVGREGNG